MARLKVNPTRMVLSMLKRRLETARRGHKLLKDKQDELMRQFITRIRLNQKLREEVEAELAESFRDFMLASAVMQPERLEQAVAYSKVDIRAKLKVVNCMSVRIPELEFVRLPSRLGVGEEEASEHIELTEEGLPAASGEMAGTSGTARTAGTPQAAKASGTAERHSGSGATTEKTGDEAEQLQPLQQVEFSYGFAQTTADLDAAIARLDRTLDRLLELAEVEKSCQLMADAIESTRRRVNALEYRTIPDLEETIKFIRMKLDENERSTITRLMKVKEMISDDSESKVS